MPDDKLHLASRDRSRIDLSEALEVRYWADKFGITTDQLTQAVKRAGSRASFVAFALGKSL